MTKTKMAANTANNPDNEENAYKKIEMPTGWICPLCGRALSPWTSCCPCRTPRPVTCPDSEPIVNPSITWNSSTAKEIQIEWKDLHSNDNDVVFIGDVL